LLKDITPAMVEAYRQQRLFEPSGRTPQHLTAPATVNREVACLKCIFNKAVKNDKAERNPAHGVKHLEENNERDRVLTLEEYARLLAHCTANLKPIVKMAYHTGMRQGEILNLVWDRVDLKEGFIRLQPEDCKTKEGRDVYLNREMVEMLRAMPRGLPGVRVFAYKGKALGSTFQKAFNAAKKLAKIDDFTFHDLRHTYVTDRDREGHSHFVIMAQTGHKTMSMLGRYRKVDRGDLKALGGENR
jgi:integrase